MASPFGAKRELGCNSDKLERCFDNLQKGETLWIQFIDQSNNKHWQPAECEKSAIQLISKHPNYSWNSYAIKSPKGNVLKEEVRS